LEIRDMVMNDKLAKELKLDEPHMKTNLTLI